VFVGYDRGDLDDEIGFRPQAGHFEVDPNEIFWRFHDYERAAFLSAAGSGMVAEQPR
jgi:hypothetical protein